VRSGLPDEATSPVRGDHPLGAGDLGHRSPVDVARVMGRLAGLGRTNPSRVCAMSLVDAQTGGRRRLLAVGTPSLVAAIDVLPRPCEAAPGSALHACSSRARLRASRASAGQFVIARTGVD
jgi:hypothetical protein